MKTADPRLTAYALGEIPPAERAEIEAQLKDDPALAAELEATWSIAAQLRSELKTETPMPLTEDQRAEVIAALRPPDPVVVNNLHAFPAPHSGRKGRRVLALAASLAVCAGAFALWGTVRYQGAKNSVAASGIADPRGWESYARFEKLAVRVGDKLTGGDVADGLGADRTLIGEALAADGGGIVRWYDQSPRNMNPGSAAEPAAASPLSMGSVAVSEAVMGEATQGGTGLKPQGGTRIAEVHRLANQTSVPVLAVAPAEGENTTINTKEIAGRIASLTRVMERGATSSSRRPSRHQTAPATLPQGKAQLTVGASGDGAVDLSVVHRLYDDERRRADRSLTPADRSGNTEAYDAITDNAFRPVKDHPLSTLSIDVDTASYANVRRFLTGGSLPPKGAVRIEEMLNYFPYDYPQPAGDAPFSATMEVAACPWAPEHRLVRIGLKGKDLARSERPAANLVFLIDVSGSMQPTNKLPLVKESLRLLVDQLDDRDQVAIAVYAGASGTVLEPTRDKAAMRAALSRLEAGGSTNGAGGIQLAYELAAKSFVKGGTNRVILATDGDFNVGITSQSDLVELIEKKAKSGVFLSVLGYGMGNLKDSTLEKLADKGNGNYGYIDTLAEAKKTLVEQMNGTLFTIAKDVKIQVEFNPAQASAYRLIGYENRLLAKEDFNDDQKDAGEIGAGHSVTALYEIVPAGGAVPGTPRVDELKYVPKTASASAPDKSSIPNPQSPISNPSASPELLTLKLRYKKPDGDVSAKLEFPLTDRGETWEKSSRDFRWAAAVASFGMLLRDSPHKGGVTWDSTLELAHEGKGEDRTGYRAEGLDLIEKARTLVR